jgi:hypothetical protein
VALSNRLLLSKLTTGTVNAPETGADSLRRSGDQTVTTLGATTLDHQTTFGCGHAGTEAVSTLAFEDTGLECSFHDEILLNGLLGQADKGRRFYSKKVLLANKGYPQDTNRQPTRNPQQISKIASKGINLWKSWYKTVVFQ